MVCFYMLWMFVFQVFTGALAYGLSLFLTLVDGFDLGLAHGGAALDRYLHANAFMVNVLIGIIKIRVSLDCRRFWW